MEKYAYFRKEVLKYIVLDFENLFLDFGFWCWLQFLEVLRLKSSSTVIRLTGISPQCRGLALHNYLMHNVLRHLMSVMLINKISDFAANLMHIVISLFFSAC